MKKCFTCSLVGFMATIPFVGIGFANPGTETICGETTYPISHIVVIFQENVSFDHYFATYPKALNGAGEPRFEAKPGTPTVNGLNQTLLTGNQNSLQPNRLDRAHAATADQDHEYQAEQQAFDHGLMDKFVQFTGSPENGGPTTVMDYFDGNTVTALWNYAQNFSMSDNSYGTTFGPSTPGLLNLVAGNTYPATPSAASTKVVPNNAGPGTLVGDLDPKGDTCSAGTTVQLGGKNIGDLLNANGVSWGAFMGGFDLTVTNANNTAGCARSSTASASNNGPTKDYIPHHAFFQYYASTV